ncbi:hypothetical protein DFH06DRAFT_494164 [Mycena polygramma]|nr:hypothetical protein DFH06DRAFT_494164 [Mycena polygramma]
MPSQHRSEGDLTSHDSLDPASELNHWERLIFSFDMQNEHNHSNTGSHGQPESAEDIQTAALLAQLAASGTMFPSSHDAPYSNMSHRQHSASGFNPGPSNPHPFVSPASLAPSPYGAHSYPMFRGGPLPPSQGPQSPTEGTRGRTRTQHNTQAGPSTSNAADDADLDDNDEYEDKRRRNTAASARFRIKKKQRTLDLERSVSDLSGRADELEREASDLRRENGWLKEIVMLKGGRLAGVDLAGNMGYPESRGQGSGARGKRRESVDGSDSESGEDRTRGSGGKGKAKGKATGKKK